MLGCPGAGKGTQSKLLCARYGIEHISTGDIFRAEIQKGSELGKKAADFVNKGSLVPDDVVVAMVAGRLGGLAGGWLLDGFPRTLQQAQALDKYLAGSRQTIDLVLDLVLAEKEVIRRLTGRRICAKCGEVFNLATKAPRQDGKCDACGGDLHQREDDKEATVRRRLMVYDDLTRPLTAYYRVEHRFFEVDAGRELGAVTETLTRLIDHGRNGAGA